MAWRGVPIVAAKRSVRAVPEVVPFTPEDDVKVCGGIVWFTFFFLLVVVEELELGGKDNIVLNLELCF